uniref:Uncharacterized protein n=1 Tax=Glossina austeni TaxID=7395 RepID=A0A1A9V667_GLOAU
MVRSSSVSEQSLAKEFEREVDVRGKVFNEICRLVAYIVLDYCAHVDALLDLWCRNHHSNWNSNSQYWTWTLWAEAVRESSNDGEALRDWRTGCRLQPKTNDKLASKTTGNKRRGGVCRREIVEVTLEEIKEALDDVVLSADNDGLGDLGRVRKFRAVVRSLVKSLPRNDPVGLSNLGRGSFSDASIGYRKGVATLLELVVLLASSEKFIERLLSGACNPSSESDGGFGISVFPPVGALNDDCGGGGGGGVGFELCIARSTRSINLCHLYKKIQFFTFGKCSRLVFASRVYKVLTLWRLSLENNAMIHQFTKSLALGTLEVHNSDLRRQADVIKSNPSQTRKAFNSSLAAFNCSSVRWTLSSGVTRTNRRHHGQSLTVIKALTLRLRK